MSDLKTQALAFRRALGQFATGVTIVTTYGVDGSRCGVTASSFNSVSLDPPMVLWALAKNAMSMEAFAASSHFTVHVLGADQQALSNRFASRGTDKFAELPCEEDEHGVPLLDGCAAVFRCRTVHRYEGGDHIIFVGEVIGFACDEKAPLLFHSGRYAELRAADRQSAMA